MDFDKNSVLKIIIQSKVHSFDYQERDMQWSYIGLPGYLHSDGMVWCVRVGV